MVVMTVALFRSILVQVIYKLFIYIHIDVFSNKEFSFESAFC